MIYKVGLLGASGRMGQEVASVLSEGFTQGADAFELADGITRSGRLVSLEGMTLRKMEEPEREPVHVWIDFSRPEATLELLARTDRPVVICTTGFSPEQREEMEQYAGRVPLMICPNTSVGVNLMSHFLSQTSALKALGFAAVLEEDHHQNKKDAPSGTAKHLLEVLAAAGYGDVQVHVTRAGSIVGNHTVRLIGDGEEIVIQHRATERRIFARGALCAAAFLLKVKAPGLYHFDEVLDLGIGETHG